MNGLMPAGGMAGDVGHEPDAGWQRRVAVVGFEALVWHRGEGFNLPLLRSIPGTFYDCMPPLCAGIRKVVTVM